MAKIINFFTKEEVITENTAYKEELAKMDLAQLIQEVDGFLSVDKESLTREDIFDGLLLFEAMEKHAQTLELKDSCSKHKEELRTLLNA